MGSIPFLAIAFLSTGLPGRPYLGVSPIGIGCGVIGVALLLAALIFRGDGKGRHGEGPHGGRFRSPLAGWGSRVGASLLDYVVLLVLLVVFLAPAAVLTAVSDGGAPGILLPIGALAFLVVLLLYASFFMQRDGEHNGQTLGKQWVGIRVVRVDGQPIGWRGALLREIAIKHFLFGVVGGIFLSIPTLLDWLWPLWDDENRALHDMVASTRVLRA